MADYTPHQKGIIKRYYKEKDNILCNRLSEIVSEMYLAMDSPKSLKKLWARAEKALMQVNIPESQRKILLEKKDIKALADLINEIF